MSDKKYTSPEHAIRNIMELRSIGHNAPTANAFFKPIGVISPPKGEEHVDGSEKVRASRNIAKERQSETMKEEEELSEAGGVNLKNAPKQRPLTDKEKEGLKPYIEFGKDITPILGTIRQAERTAEAGKETAKAYEKGEYWNAAKGAINTAGQGALTGISAVGDVITATGVGAPVVAGIKAAPALIKTAVRTAPSLIDAAKTALSGGRAATVAPKAAAVTAPKVTASQAKPETVKAPETTANFYNPKTQKTYKSKAESDIATKEFDLAAAAKKAGGQAQAKTQADVSAPTKQKADIKLELPTSKGELTVPGSKKPAAPEVEAIPKGQEKTFPGQGAPKKTTRPPTIELKATEVAPPKAPKAAEKPQDFEIPKGAKKAETKGSTTQKAPEVEIPKGPSVKEKESPTKFKFAEPPTSKGELVPVTKQPAKIEPKIKLKIKDSNLPAVKQPTDVVPSTKLDKKIEVKPEVKVPSRVTAKPETKTSTTTRQETKTKQETKTRKPEGPPKRGKPGRGSRFLPFSLPGLTPGQGIGFHQDSNVPVDIYKHVPKEYMTFEQTRYDIENVARPNSKDKVKIRSKQTEIIRKIIEEKKASKKNTTVIINPELKQQEPEQTK